MKSFSLHPDILRLAGVSKVLGVDISDERAEIVQVEAKGNPLSKHRQRFFPSASLTISFSPTDTLETKSEKVKNALKENGISTSLAITSLQTSGIKTIHATIPSDATDIGEWIEENLDRLLRVPVSRDEIVIEYEILEKQEVHHKIIIVIAKKQDIQQVEQLFTKAGLDLLSIGYLRRDFVNGVVHDGKCIVLHTAEEKISIYFLENRSLKVYRECSTGEILESLKIESENYRFENAVIYGENFLEVGENREFRLLDISKVPKNYFHAYGLGIKGFLDTFSPVSFLSSGQKERIVDRIGQNILKRSVLVFGMIFFVLLSFQTISSIVIESKYAEIESLLFEEDSKVQQLATLRQEIGYFESEIQKQGVSRRRSSFARTMAAISEETHDGIVLQSVLSVMQSPQSEVITIKGDAVSNESVSRYLRSLQSNRLISNVELKRSGIASGVKRASVEKITFEAIIHTKK